MSEEIDATVLRVAEEVEKRASDRETKRFRVLYAVIAALSFVGIGVITQLIDFYATRAVDQRLELSRQELESTRTYSQLLALATQLDMRDSFSHTDRDTIIRLLDQAKDNTRLRNDAAFGSLLQKIIYSFAASDNAVFLSYIFDIYQRESLRTAGIVEVLLQHYAKRLLAAESTSSHVFAADLKRFEVCADAADTYRMRGATAILRGYVAFKISDRAVTPELQAKMQSVRAFGSADRQMFLGFVEQFSSEHSLSKVVRPDEVRIADLAKQFNKVFESDIAALGPIDSEASDGSSEKGESADLELLKKLLGRK